jgi:hypothetical protein
VPATAGAPLWRLRSLGNANLVARIDVGIQPTGAELDHYPLALLGAALDRGTHEPALLRGEARAEALPNGIDVRPLTVRGDALRDLRLDVPRPQDDQTEDGRNRDHRSDKREQAYHRLTTLGERPVSRRQPSPELRRPDHPSERQSGRAAHGAPGPDKRVGSRSREQKVNDSSHQELAAKGLVRKRSAGVSPAGCPLRARRRKRTSRLRTQERPANADLLKRAAEGIRTLDLLHGKQYVRWPTPCEYACKPAVSGFLGTCGPRRLPGFHREITRIWVANG